MSDNSNPVPETTTTGPLFAAVAMSTPISVQIAERLITAIDTGLIQAGSRLASEKELSAQFGVSRATIREALSCLQFAGRAESRRGSGTVILASSPRQNGGPLRNVGQIIQVLEARLIVEPLLLRLAAEDPHPAGLRRVRQMLEGMQLSLDSPTIHPHSDFRVHQALIHACRNVSLVEAGEALLAKCDGPLWRSIQDTTWDKGTLPKHWLGQHHTIATAVSNKQPDIAEKAARTHLLSVLSNVGLSTPLGESEAHHVRRIQSRYAADSGE